MSLEVSPAWDIARQYTSKGDDVLRKTIGLLVSLCIAASYNMALAQTSAPAASDNDTTSSGQLKEVVVTAEYRRQNLQYVPNAISVFSGKALSDVGIADVGGLTEVSPSLVWGNSAGEPHLSIRGIGNENINIGAEPGVTISQDGVPLVDSLMFQHDFLDTANVEVLRGPQGTVSGRNSPGGAIDIYSDQPTETPEGEASVGYGNFNRVQSSDFVSGPIDGDTLMGRAAVSYVKDDGWLDNTYLHQMEESQNEIHGRAYVTYKPSDVFTLSFIFEGFNNLGFGLAGVDAGRVQPDIPSLSEYYLGHPSFNINNLTFQENDPGPFTSSGTQETVRAEWNFGSAGKLTSITGYQRFQQHGIRDYDATPISFPPGTPGYLVEEINQLSQELTYLTDLGSRADLIVGALFLEQHGEEPFGLGGTSFAAAPILYHTYQEDDSTAVYTQLRYKFTDKLRLTLGARETRDEKTYSQQLYLSQAPTGGPLNVEGSWSAFTPRVALTYTPTESVSFYTDIAKGYTAGGLNSFSGQKYNPEFVWSYEVGMKSYWLDHRLKLDADVFHSDFKEIQEVLFIPSGNLTTALSVTNAGAAKINGFETELEARVTDHFLLSATGTLLNAYFTQLKSVDGSVPQEGVLNLAGNKLPRSPTSQFDLGAHYTNIPVSANWALSFHANYAWQARIYFNFFNQPLLSQASYGLLNVSATLNSADGKWQLTGFSNNATDKRYWSNIQFGTALAAVPYVNGMIGEPRTYGFKIARLF